VSKDVNDSEVQNGVVYGALQSRLRVQRDLESGLREKVDTGCHRAFHRPEKEVRPSLYPRFDRISRYGGLRQPMETNLGPTVSGESFPFTLADGSPKPGYSAFGVMHGLLEICPSKSLS
jgi:hypothetical protein